MAGMDRGFARSACSYEDIASSRLPRTSAKLPVDIEVRTSEIPW